MALSIRQSQAYVICVVVEVSSYKVYELLGYAVDCVRLQFKRRARWQVRHMLFTCGDATNCARWKGRRVMFPCDVGIDYTRWRVKRVLFACCYAIDYTRCQFRHMLFPYGDATDCVRFHMNSVFFPCHASLPPPLDCCENSSREHLHLVWAECSSISDSDLARQIET